MVGAHEKQGTIRVQVAFQFFIHITQKLLESFLFYYGLILLKIFQCIPKRGSAARPGIFIVILK